MRRPSRTTLRHALVTVSSATIVCGSLVLAQTPALASAPAPRTTAPSPVVTQMSDLTAFAISTVQSERAAAPLNNGSSTFPASVNAALATLSYRSSTVMVRADMGLPLAAIGNYLVTGNTRQRDFAVNSINTLLAAQQQPNGALSNSPDAADIDTMFFATHLGMAAMALGSNLDATDRTRWANAVAAAADYLSNNRNIPSWDPVHNRWLDGWYTNGNIVVGNTLVMALAYRLTGDAKYLGYYNTALQFAIAPSQTRWPGYGFVTDRQPTNADGSDGSGYFTEAGTSPGYDGDYTMLQSDQLSRLYLVTRDPAVLRLLNMVTNELLSRTNTSTWMLNSSNGTRHNYPAEVLDTGAIAVLAEAGGRTDLQPLVASQVASTDREFRVALAQQVPFGDRFLYALGTIPVDIILAASPMVPQSSAMSSTTTPSTITTTSTTTKPPSQPGTISSLKATVLPTSARIVSNRSNATVGGVLWRSDAHDAVGGSYVTTTKHTTGTTSPGLFARARVGGHGYNIQLAPGRYRVTIGVAQRPSTRAGTDQFLVRARGVAVHYASPVSHTKKYRARYLSFLVRISQPLMTIAVTTERGRALISNLRVARA